MKSRPVILLREAAPKAVMGYDPTGRRPDLGGRLGRVIPCGTIAV